MNSSTNSDPSNKAKICPHCGKQISEDWLLCPNCGADLPAPLTNISYPQANLRDVEISAAQRLIPKRTHKKLLIFWVLVLLALTSLYYAMGLILIQQINTAYYSRDCQNALGQAAIIKELYPPVLMSSVRVATAQINECEAYSNAETEYNKKNWQSAYEDYSAYMGRYPQGIFLADSSSKAAEALYAWAQEERTAGNFDSALEKLNAITGKFSGTSEATNANGDIPEIYLEWGKTLEASGNFDNAENEFKNVLRTDPNSQAPGSPSNQLQAILPEFYQKWAANLISQGKYEEAISHYESAHELISSDKLQTIQDGLADTQVKWALSMSGSGDFTGALAKIADARSAATSTAAQNESESGYQSILRDFSNSTGTQASQALNQAATDVCKSGQLSASELPIFGIDPQQKDVYFLGDSADTNGLNDQAASSLGAKSPASLHYVACITTSTITIQSCPYTMGYTLHNDQTFWQVELYDVVRGRYLGSTHLAGGNPSGCPSTYLFTVGQDIATHTGPAPTYGDFETWLLPRITR